MYSLMEKSESTATIDAKLIHNYHVLNIVCPHFGTNSKCVQHQNVRILRALACCACFSPTEGVVGLEKNICTTEGQQAAVCTCFH